MGKSTTEQEREVSRLQHQLASITLEYEATMNQIQVAHAVYSIVLDETRQPVDYIILNVNKKYEEITGLSLQKIRWRSIKELFGQHSNVWEGHFKNAIASGKPVRIEFHMESSGHWYDLMIHSPGNNLLLITFLDITERKSTETELRESRLVLDDMGAMAKVGGWEHDFTSGKAYWTKYTYIITGLDPDTPPPSFDDHFDFLPNDHRVIVKAHYDNAISELKSFNVEAKINNRTGKELWVKIYGEPVVKGGRCAKLRGFIQDITDIKTAELELLRYQQELQRKNEEYQAINEEFLTLNEELSESNAHISKLNDRLVTEKVNSEKNEALYRTIFNTIREGIFIYSSRDKLEYVNPAACEMHGRTEQELTAMNPQEFIHPDTYQVFLDFIEAVDKDEEFLGEASGITKANGRFDVIVYGCPILINGKKMYYSRIRDVTLQKQYERKLEEQNQEMAAQNEEYLALNEELEESNLRLRKANQELDSFVYRVSHDMRAPIASSLGLAMLCLQESEMAELKKYTKLQYECLKRLDNFIKDILDYSRNARMEIIQEDIELEHLIHEIVSTQQAFDFSEKRIDFQLSIAGSKIIHTDRSRLKIVLNNLLSNAFKYYDTSKENPFVRVDITQDGRTMKLSVSDNGIGIGREHRDRVFDMFYRGTEKRTGSGIGLYIVKDCLSKLKGSIDFTSRKGEGSQFVVMLPVHKC